MRRLALLLPALLLLPVVSACAASRAPLTDVPTGEYVLVEPEPQVFNAVRVAPRAFTVRMGDEIHSGEHWVDDGGRLRMADMAGPCQDQESIWNYQYANNRVTLTLVEDRCQARAQPFPQRMVYERRY
ncbi:MAG: hypothetical protein WD960_08945 [Gemmatimonadota bacterium]